MKIFFQQKSKIIFFLFTFYLLLTTVNVQAALVPCGPGVGKPCEFCDLITLVNNVINFALYDIAIPLIVVMIVWGGFVIMTAGDSTEKVSQGRKIIQSAIIGVLIALGAWMIINMVLSAIGGGSFAPWKFGNYSIC
ncbi:MAG: pilin [Patescibacteria group bacterium]|nr:pilin [Patescibacteria group bacterium]